MQMDKGVSVIFKSDLLIFIFLRLTQNKILFIISLLRVKL